MHEGKTARFIRIERPCDCGSCGRGCDYRDDPGRLPGAEGGDGLCPRLGQTWPALAAYVLKGRPDCSNGGVSLYFDTILVPCSGGELPPA